MLPSLWCTLRGYDKDLQRSVIQNFSLSALAVPAAMAAAAGLQHAWAAAWVLLAKLYLNAEVYTGASRYADCATYCEKIINSNQFQLDDVYQDVFLADNNTSPEIIFPIVYDGLYAQTWGGTTFMICSALGGSMVAADYGVNGKWAGNRATRPFIEKFTDTTEDSRWMFYTAGQQIDITSMSTFTQGYANPKYKNKTKDGLNGSNNATSAHVDVDFPMFRLADVFLMYAEAKFRTGDEATALTYMNKIRERAYGDQTHNYTRLVLQDFLDERARELNWECTRRTDLIRFDQFTGDIYLWPFKGGLDVGQATEVKYNLYPIPTSDIVLNPNLQQNPGF